jgi:hypothetical protein
VEIAALTVVKVNPNQGSYLQLVGTVLGGATGNLGTISYEWTKTSGDDPSDDSGYASVFAVDVFRLNTVVELGALTEGSVYAFRLTAFARGKELAFANGRHTHQPKVGTRITLVPTNASLGSQHALSVGPC